MPIKKIKIRGRYLQPFFPGSFGESTPKNSERFLVFLLGFSSISMSSSTGFFSPFRISKRMFSTELSYFSKLDFIGDEMERR